MSKGRHALLASPMAGWLQLSEKSGDLFQLEFHERFIGNPAIRAYHGGVVASLLEHAALCVFADAIKANAAPKSVNVNIDYLRSAEARDLNARARIIRIGKRVAFVEAAAWQDSEDKPVAVGRFRLRAV